MPTDQKTLSAYKKDIADKFEAKMAGKNVRLLCCKLDESRLTVFYDFAPYGSPLPRTPSIGIYNNNIEDEEQCRCFLKPGARRDGFELARVLFKGLDQHQFQNNTQVIMFVDSKGNKI